MPSSFTNPVENDASIGQPEFRLLRPPGFYTLTEMFDDRMNKKCWTPKESLVSWKKSSFWGFF